MITKIYKLFRAGLVCCCATAALTACSPEKFDGPNQGGIPSISNVDINMTVDQTVNQATFTVANMPAQTYAIWKVTGRAPVPPYVVGAAVSPDKRLVVTTSQGRQGKGGQAVAIFAQGPVQKF